MTAINLKKFAATPLNTDPYEYLIVPGFLKSEAIKKIDNDYPSLPSAGSFAISSVKAGAAFTELISEMSGKSVQMAFAEKFGIDLTGRPLTATVRGFSQLKDGRIHTDTPSKILTLLIYMNTEWTNSGGRLRVLRSADNLQDYAAEVPPEAGTLLAFRRSERSWHGHEQFHGMRKVIQLNWVTSRKVLQREIRRHKISAMLKKINPFTQNSKRDIG
ncbi:MAG: hypothetical protein CMM44_08080 [Rhodospirillaceae bacterium]|nr:hypothetical protein [Rhodospirillaceae bacterium]|tara:strand:+ start:1379 stop:2026 length:648 start_codon:yes stop_codon:yes gene_type:complete